MSDIARYNEPKGTVLFLSQWIDKHEHGGVAAHIRDALLCLGYEVTMFPYRAIRCHDKTKRLWDQASNKMMEAILLKTVKELKPDIVLTFKGDKISPEVFKQLRRRGCYLVFCTPDDPDRPTFRASYPIIKHHHLVLTCCEWSRQQYEAMGLKAVLWYPSIDPDWHYHDVLQPGHRLYERFHCDICLAGSCYTFGATPRPDLARAIIKQQPAAHFKIFGFQWDSKTPDLRDHWHGRVSEASVRYIYSNSLININTVNWRGGETWDMTAQFFNWRVLEVLGCAGFLLCERVKDAEVVFKDREHLVYFDDLQHCVDLCRYYLDHPEERELIARQGQVELYSKWTTFKQLRNIMIRVQQERARL